MHSSHEKKKQNDVKRPKRTKHRQKGAAVPPVCPDCGERARLTDNAIIYGGRSYGKSWVCPHYPRCDNYVGCHRDGKPLGTLASKALRYWRHQAHNAFDPLWKGGAMSRHEAYAFMRDILGLKKSAAHIGKMNEEQCRKLIEALRERKP